MSSDSAKTRISPPEDSANGRVVHGRNRERRRFQRLPFNADAEVVELQSGTKIGGRVTHLSLGGCYVDTLSPFLRSTTVDITIVRGTQVFEAQAKVTYCKLGKGMGLEFVSAQAEHKKVLGSWIVDLGGELPRTSASKQGGVKGMSNDQLSSAIGELMRLLVRKGMLTETERQEILANIERAK
jgi:PilZ domain